MWIIENLSDNRNELHVIKRQQTETYDKSANKKFMTSLDTKELIE